MNQPGDAPVKRTGTDKGRGHFLPFATNAFDRVFIAVVLWIAIHLLWMRFLEAAIPLWGAAVISAILGVYVIWRG